MLRGKHLKIIIAADGTCTIDALNFAGPACQAATQEITAALAGQIDHEHTKPELRQREWLTQADREQAR